MRLRTPWRNTMADLRRRLRQAGLTPFDRFELVVMYLFTRFWHRCAQPLGILPLHGPLVVIANHSSHADPGFLIASCTRRLHFLHARECYDVPVLRWLFARAGCIPVTRGGRDIGAMRRALAILRAGGVVVVFPEGEISSQAGGPLRLGQTGAAMLALRAHAPVVPAWIEGGPQSRRVLGAWLIPSTGVRVAFGSPIDLTAYAARRRTHRLLTDVTALLMRQLADVRERCAKHETKADSAQPSSFTFHPSFQPPQAAVS